MIEQGEAVEGFTNAAFKTTADVTAILAHFLKIAAGDLALAPAFLAGVRVGAAGQQSHLV